MSSNKFTDLIDIEENTPYTDDDTGQLKDRWSVWKQAYVKFEPQGGNDFRQDNQQRNLLNHRIRMWYDADLTVRHRFRQDERVINLLAMFDPDRRGRELVVIAQEVI